jgi:hypothetical protein
LRLCIFLHGLFRELAYRINKTRSAVQAHILKTLLSASCKIKHSEE